MIELLLQLDRDLFLFINHLPHNFLLDSFFSLLSFVGYFGAVWFSILILLFIWKEIKERDALWAFLLSSGITLIFSELALKNLIGRLRPEFSIPTALVIFDSTHSFSFPSGHATIAFAAAYILSVYHRKFAKWYYLFAALISFSRIYLGKHYPSDVLAGAVLGLLIGIMSLKIVNKSLR